VIRSHFGSSHFGSCTSLVARCHGHSAQAQGQDGAANGSQGIGRCCPTLSESEDIQDSSETAEKEVVLFGQHKGKTFAQVHREALPYCRWVVAESLRQGAACDPRLSTFGRWLRSQGVEGMRPASSSSYATLEKLKVHQHMKEERAGRTLGIASVRSGPETLAASQNVDRPKRPESCYQLFVRDFREANKGRLTAMEVVQQAGQEWRKLPEADRARYAAAWSAM